MKAVMLEDTRRNCAKFTPSLRKNATSERPTVSIWISRLVNCRESSRSMITKAR
jgi:hypothetical protein